MLFFIESENAAKSKADIIADELHFTDDRCVFFST